MKYSVSIPRYTSYPTAPEWTESFTASDFLQANETANKNKTLISLYFHLPFCESQCYFCACNVVISKKKEITDQYLIHIKKEVENLSQHISKDRIVEQIHLGGGTPTYFNPEQLKELFGSVKNNFNISKSCEIGIEVDPRVTNHEDLKSLSEVGFNRISMGIQDFNERVQKAINRIQPYEETKGLFNSARNLRFESINVDLIYGLPWQTKESFKNTIDLIISMNPDRIALFHYAHLPQMIKHQAKYIPQESLPDSSTKTDIFLYAARALTNNGYAFIGLDHFAKPNDELAQARKNKTLHRNFQGYTTKASCDLYGFGITAISNVQNTYSQNIKKINSYYESVDLNKIPIYRGIISQKDDELRKHIIMAILCHGEIKKPDIEKRFNIDFNSYFTDELAKLNNFKKEELLEITNDIITITEPGRFFLRNIASVFDSYFQKKDGKQKNYSKSV